MHVFKKRTAQLGSQGQHTELIV